MGYFKGGDGRLALQDKVEFAQTMQEAGVSKRIESKVPAPSIRLQTFVHEADAYCAVIVQQVLPGFLIDDERQQTIE